MARPRCTICIPAWQAEAFIERTLDNAQAQTEPDIAIHVGVDLGDDRTVELCEARAASDGRIRVLRHRERQGWANNCNALIDSVSSPYQFFYFHDDLIEPHYVERLCGMLDERPDAASAHGDVQHFGATSQLARSGAYEGAAAERLFRFVAAGE
jgi:GT2 family glycosyltransferase